MSREQLPFMDADAVAKLADEHGSVTLFADTVPEGREVDVWGEEVDEDGDVVLVGVSSLWELDKLQGTFRGVWRCENCHDESTAGGAAYFMVTSEKP
jgi:hypothetical protein